MTYKIPFNKEIKNSIVRIDEQLADIVHNIKNFGAKYDGSDDCLAFQQATNSVKRIFIPEGNLSVSSVNFGSNNIIIEGTGVNSIITIENTPTDKHGLYSDTTGDITFKNVKFVIKTGHTIGNGNNGGSPFAFRYGNRVKFDNCYFDASNTQVGFSCSMHIRKLDTFIFKDCIVEGYRGYFIVGVGIANLNTNINNIMIYNNKVTGLDNSLSFFNIDNEPDNYPSGGIINDNKTIIVNNEIIRTTQGGSHAFGIGYMKNAILTGNIIKYFDYGFDIDNPNNVTASDNIIVATNSTYAGFRIGTDGTEPYLSNKLNQYVKITNNTIDGFAKGITIGEIGNIIGIEMNLIKNCGTSIYSYNNTTLSIKNNTIELNTNNVLIDWNGCTDITIDNNNVYLKTGATGIYLFTCQPNIASTSISIKNNKLIGNINTVGKIFNGFSNIGSCIVENNMGINDLDIITLKSIAGVVFGGMKINIANKMCCVVGTYGALVIASTSKIVASETITATSDIVMNTYAKTVYCNSGSPMSVFVNRSAEFNSLQDGSTFTITNMTSNVVVVNFQGFSTGDLSGLTNTFSLTNYKTLKFIIIGGVLYKISSYQPAITGSRGGNVALASLLTQLATLGIITDSTTT